jgi:hypothetical protein
LEGLHRYAQIYLWAYIGGLVYRKFTHIKLTGTLPKSDNWCGYVLSKDASETSEILKAQLNDLKEAKMACWTIPELVYGAKQLLKTKSSIVSSS